MAKHANGLAQCPSCVEKIKTSHPIMQEWFLYTVKPRFPDCHVSWAWRNKIDQNQFHAEGKSMRPWPLSDHNKMDDQGNPCSLALDFFQLCTNGMAAWPYKYFRDIASVCEIKFYNIEWAGSLCSGNIRQSRI